MVNLELCVRWNISLYYGCFFRINEVNIMLIIKNSYNFYSSNNQVVEILKLLYT